MTDKSETQPGARIDAVDTEEMIDQFLDRLSDGFSLKKRRINEEVSLVVPLEDQADSGLEQHTVEVTLAPINADGDTEEDPEKTIDFRLAMECRARGQEDGLIVSLNLGKGGDRYYTEDEDQSIRHFIDYVRVSGGAFLFE